MLASAQAQDIEPRAYSNAPVGVNFLIAGYAYTEGAVPFDASLPVSNAQLKTSNAILAYARVLDVWGMSGKFDAIVPYTWLSGTAEVRGASFERIVDGLADARPSPVWRAALRSMSSGITAGSDHRRQPAGIRAFGPVITAGGNIGTNRWSFKPEIGISKAMGPWTLEFQAAATFFTDNRDFYGGNTRSQDPIFSLQGHVIYGSRSGGSLTPLTYWRSDDAQRR
jgi:hypothetical protein